MLFSYHVALDPDDLSLLEKRKNNLLRYLLLDDPQNLL